MAACAFLNSKQICLSHLALEFSGSTRAATSSSIPATNCQFYTRSITNLQLFKPNPPLGRGPNSLTLTVSLTESSHSIGLLTRYSKGPASLSLSLGPTREPLNLSPIYRHSPVAPRPHGILCSKSLEVNLKLTDSWNQTTMGVSKLHWHYYREFRQELAHDRSLVVGCRSSTGCRADSMGRRRPAESLTAQPPPVHIEVTASSLICSAPALALQVQRWSAKTCVRTLSQVVLEPKGRRKGRSFTNQRSLSTPSHGLRRASSPSARSAARSLPRRSRTCRSSPWRR